MSFVHIPAVPQEEPLSADYTVSVEGQPLPLHTARVSAQAYNRWWPGHQRPIDQTELASFGSFDFEGTVRVEITVNFTEVHKVEIRPAAFGIVPTVEGNRISFVLDRPRHFSVEVNGWHRCLHLFTQETKDYGISPDDPDVIYFGPGVHYAGLICPKEGQTVYIDESAIVYGRVFARHADNVRLLGRGILDSAIYRRLGDFGRNGGEPGSDPIDEAAKAMDIPGDEKPQCLVTVVGGKHFEMDGVILRDPPYWTCNIGGGCEDVTIRNVKVIGLWRHNADGFDLCALSHCRVSDCYLRTFDDSIVIRGAYRNCDPAEMHDIVVEDTVMWCDWGRGIEFWTCGRDADIHDVIFRRCQVVRATHIAIDFQVYGGSDAKYHDITIEDVEVMCDEKNDRPVYQRSDDIPYPGAEDPDYVPMLLYCGYSHNLNAQRSRVRMFDITVRNLVWTDPRTPVSNFEDEGELLKVYDITMENWRFNGRPVETALERGFTIKSRWKELPPEDQY